MIRAFQAGLASLVVVVALSWAESAEAQVFAPFYGFAAGTGPYNLYSQQQPPYFSLYPPVYYSRPVARSYGWSPFAYPPGVMTPEVAEPMEIENPHAAPKAPAKPTADQSAVQPLMIENPFVQQGVASR